MLNSFIYLICHRTKKKRVYSILFLSFCSDRLTTPHSSTCASTDWSLATSGSSRWRRTRTRKRRWACLNNEWAGQVWTITDATVWTWDELVTHLALSQGLFAFFFSMEGWKLGLVHNNSTCANDRTYKALLMYCTHTVGVWFTVGSVIDVEINSQPKWVA